MSVSANLGSEQEASIHLPNSVFARFNDSTIDITVGTYESPVLFPRSNLVSNYSHFSVASSIVSVTIPRINATDLESDVEITMGISEVYQY